MTTATATPNTSQLPPLQLNLGEDVLKGLVEQVLETVVDRFNSRKLIPEAEAAEMLSLTKEQIQGERHMGRIKAVQGRQKRVFYTPEALDDYVASLTEWSPQTAKGRG